MGIITGVVLLLTSLIGILGIVAGHLSLLASLNTTLISLWKGMPYLMAALGGPGLLLFLGGIIVGVILVLNMFRKRIAEPLIPGREKTIAPQDVPDTPKPAPKYSIVEDMEDTFTDGTKQYTIR